MATSIPTVEADFTFTAPTGEQVTTWYKVVGDLKSGITPLVTLHGGPGAGHSQMLPLTDMFEQRGIPIVFYDQVGCGRSTHFRDRQGDNAFWSWELYVREIDELVDHLGLRDTGFSLVGKSWGAVLAGYYAMLRPRGLQRLVIQSGPASVPLFVRGLHMLLDQLPPDVKKTLIDCDARGDHSSPEFMAASEIFMKKHFCRLDVLPDDLQRSMDTLKEDPTSYITVQGPTEFIITGWIKDWEGIKDAHKIEVDTLLINGRYDEVTDMSVAPWFKEIPKVKWVTLENSAHCGQFEDRERYMEVCGAFLAD
ncbi:proline-specific peptidase [Thozetella sp. PMI_491]|nr:proline-specific peptidase [Thozetella sp. PMI_491]